jgi:hypothetical protein
MSATCDGADRGRQPIIRARHDQPDDAMRLDLKVPFAEKDQAKKLGARWDAARKRWYIDDRLDPALFVRWQPTPQGATAIAPPPRPSTPAGIADDGKMQVGSRFAELPRVCDCLPWDDCDQCRLQAWPS